MSVTPKNVNQCLTELLPRLIKIRQDLHRHPELGFQERRTQGVVRDWLREYGYEPRECAGTGLVADLHPEAGPTIALRGDMDALPMTESMDLPYHSVNPGCAHKCGHDGHTAILMGMAAVLAQLRPQIKGNVRLLFQPAEEGVGEGGAKIMVREGALAGVKEVYGLHNWPGFPKGEVRVAAGPVMAAVHTLELKLIGKGGHGSQPQTCRDPLAAGAQIVTALQNIISREVGCLERAVLSICSFQGGSTHNIIPETAELSGTIRTFSPTVQKRLLNRVEEVIKGVARAMGVEADLNLYPVFPVLENDPTCANAVNSICAEVLGADKVSSSALPLAASEDFAYLTQAVPGAYFFLGAGNSDGHTPACHHRDYDFEDELIAPAINILWRLTRARLAAHR